jgi:hypothetical protein
MSERMADAASIPLVTGDVAGAGVTAVAPPHFRGSIDNLRAYADCFDLRLGDGEVEELTEGIEKLFTALESLWRYDLDGIATSLTVRTAGRR